MLVRIAGTAFNADRTAVPPRLVYLSANLKSTDEAVPMVAILLVVLAIALAAMRRWRTDDVEWFEVSALLEAILLGVFLLMPTPMVACRFGIGIGYGRGIMAVWRSWHLAEDEEKSTFRPAVGRAHQLAIPTS